MLAVSPRSLLIHHHLSRINPNRFCYPSRNMVSFQKVDCFESGLVIPLFESTPSIQSNSNLTLTLLRSDYRSLRPPQWEIFLNPFRDFHAAEWRWNGNGMENRRAQRSTNKSSSLEWRSIRHGREFPLCALSPRQSSIPPRTD